MKEAFATALRKLGDDVAGKIETKLSNLGKPDEPSDEDLARIIKTGLDLAELQTLTGNSEEELRAMTADSGGQALDIVGATDAGGLVDQINQRAVDWARGAS